MLSGPTWTSPAGESVFVEQRPRQQSRPMVLRPGPGPGGGLPGAPPAPAAAPAATTACRCATASAPCTAGAARARHDLPQRALHRRESAHHAGPDERGVRLDAITPPRWLHRRRPARRGPGRAPPAAARPAVGGRGPPGHVPVRAHQHRAALHVSASASDVDHRERRPARDPVGRGPPRGGVPTGQQREPPVEQVERGAAAPVHRHPGVRRPLPRVRTRRPTTRSARRGPRRAGRARAGRPCCSDRRARYSPDRAPLLLVAVQQRPGPPSRARPRPASSPGCARRRSRCSCRPPPTRVIRCAASPTRKPLPARNVSASSAAIDERQPRQHLHVEVRHPDGRPDQLDAPRRREVGGRLAALGEPLPP